MFQNIKQYYQRMVPAIAETDWEALERRLHVQVIKKGDFLLKAGDICRYVSFVERGLLRLFYVADGKEVSSAFVPEREYISEYSSFLTATAAAQSIDALEDTEVINLSFTDMQELYKTHPVFEQFGRKIAEKLFILLSDQVTRLLTLSPEERYLFILHHQPYILQRVPQYMIASCIGITPEHLSRLRKKLSAGTY